MSLAVLCAPCEMGDHDRHDARGTTRPGLIGGHYCPCPGGCEPQPNPLLDAMMADLLGHGDADEGLIEVISKAIADAQMHSHVEYKRRVGLAGRRTMAQTILWRLREHASGTSQVAP